MTKPRVKPLVWDDWYGGMTIAKTPWGDYTISRDWLIIFPSGSVRRYKSEKAAKAAAQADYEARILSALDLTPDPAVSVDLAEAVKVLEGVTPGPWEVEHKHGTIRLMMGDSCQMCDETYYPWVPDNEKDWHFIAWCRQGVPTMLALATAQAARIEGLQTDNEALKSARDMVGEYWNTAVARAEKAETARAAEKARVAKLVEALRFYASESLWDCDGGIDSLTPMERDGGKRARETIAAITGCTK